MYLGTIRGLRGSWGSGLAVLLVEDPSGELHHIPCENGPTVRALDDAFGGILAGRRFVEAAIFGEEIEYALDEIGCLAWFAPAGEVADA